MLHTELDIEYSELSHQFEGLIKDRNNVILSKDFVHKEKSDNVFVSDMKIIESNEFYDCVVTLFHIPRDHYYFF